MLRPSGLPAENIMRAFNILCLIDAFLLKEPITPIDVYHGVPAGAEHRAPYIARFTAEPRRLLSDERILVLAGHLRPEVMSIDVAPSSIHFGLGSLSVTIPRPYGHRSAPATSNQIVEALDEAITILRMAPTDLRVDDIMMFEAMLAPLLGDRLRDNEVTVSLAAMRSGEPLTATSTLEFPQESGRPSFNFACAPALHDLLRERAGNTIGNFLTFRRSAAVINVGQPCFPQPGHLSNLKWHKHGPRTFAPKFSDALIFPWDSAGELPDDPHSWVRPDWAVPDQFRFEPALAS